MLLLLLELLLMLLEMVEQILLNEVVHVQMGVAVVERHGCRRIG